MPYIQEPLPVVSTPPMRTWYLLQLPNSSGITELKRINMPGLEELYCDGNPLTTLPWDDVQGLNYLGAYYSSFVTLELWRLPQLYALYASDSPLLETIDARDHANLSSLDLYYCYALTTLDISGCPNLQYIYTYDCGMSEAMVDQLLTDLVGNGTEDGYADLSGNNAPPSNPDGLALKAILISRGWTIYT